VIHGQTGYSTDLEPITIKEWTTLDGYKNILANTREIQFEYEERRNWYALRIKRISTFNEGAWKCRMVVKFEGKKIYRRYESRKHARIRNKSEFFTFKVSIKRDILSISSF
jgi:hypothetical protein